MVSRGQAERSSLPDAFTVVVWNIHKEREAVLELTALADGASLVLLQEGTGPDLPLPGEATQAVSFRFVRGGAMTGVLTVSRAEARASRPLRTDANEPLVGTPKTALVSRFALESGASLLVVNLHGINLRGARHLETQLGAIEAEAREHAGPMLVAGDFNTWSRPRRAVVLAFAERLGLEAVFDGPEAPRLDAVFVRGLEVQEARVVDTRSSDHDALVVTLYFRSKRISSRMRRRSASRG